LASVLLYNICKTNQLLLATVVAILERQRNTYQRIQS